MLNRTKLEVSSVAKEIIENIFTTALKEVSKQIEIRVVENISNLSRTITFRIIEKGGGT